MGTNRPAVGSGFNSLAGERDVAIPPDDCNTLTLPFPRHVETAQVTLHAYPDWGLYLLKGDGLLLSFR